MFLTEELSPRKFGLLLLAFIFLALAGAALYNYTHDFSGLYSRDFSYRRQEPNQHFVKMRYLMENHGAGVKGLAFGSSRIGNVDLTSAPGGPWYNMTYSEGLPAEHLRDLQLLLEAGIRPERVLLEVNEASFRLPPEAHKFQYIRLPYGTPAENFKTYIMYLLRPLNYITGGEWNENIFDIYGTGRPLHPWIDEAIEQDPAGHAKDSRLDEAFVVHGNRLVETLSEIRAMKELCEANGIEFYMYMGPTYYLTYLGYQGERRNELKNFQWGLVAIAPYWDFTGLNPITEDRYYFYEASHYRPLVGDMIASRIFGDGSKCPSWFGCFVTPENVMEHLKAQDEEILRRQ